MKKFEYQPPPNVPISTDDLLSNLKMVAKKVNTNKITQKIYTEYGSYNASTFINRFGSWNQALKKAGLSLSNIVNYSDEYLFENILNLWEKIGKQPTRKDLSSKYSKVSQSPYSRRFKSWSNAIKSFIEYANSNDIENTNQITRTNGDQKKQRDPSLRLRYKVLKRDDFSCVCCGASPAKKTSILLHIDHIKPWSKGGVTELDNLQTLCQNCNLGKSNI